MNIPSWPKIIFYAGYVGMIAATLPLCSWEQFICLVLYAASNMGGVEEGLTMRKRPR